ncbi:hypothetical protein HPC49_22810 [Pyxidicoccus fallax]|uniref:Uncharacterized protein n=1 Tax=Pyxidicoccus fallax TaxID=394095 RepID=A0A848LFR9_9BACT|nr:hypothetical protein [Pyxidicoccus fallax]NMO17232.1 hypothetical protein [Pyxidicoccus fallax]NPC81044.1 hypothetical protein [Pyxidicoccus fallax]
MSIWRGLWALWRSRPYGRRLANKVADTLGRCHGICYDHIDYCGVGLFKRGKKFIYDHVYYGVPEFEENGAPQEGIAVFQDRESFVDWLSRQSDESLSGRDQPDPFYFNNQRITRARLKDAVAGYIPRV